MCLTRNGGGLQIIKPNKYPACQSIHQMYYECSLVTEASFGKFVNRCGGLKERLDECNVREQVRSAHTHTQHNTHMLTCAPTYKRTQTHKHAHTQTHTHTHTHAHAHAHMRAHAHAHKLSLTHTHTQTLFLTHTLILSPTRMRARQYCVYVRFGRCYQHQPRGVCDVCGCTHSIHSHTCSARRTCVDPPIRIPLTLFFWAQIVESLMFDMAGRVFTSARRNRKPPKTLIFAKSVDQRANPPIFQKLAFSRELAAFSARLESIQQAKKELFENFVRLRYLDTEKEEKWCPRAFGSSGGARQRR